MRPKRYLSLRYVWSKPCTYLALTLTPSPNGPNKIPHDACHLGVPSGASKMIPEPMVRLAQTMHLSTSTLTPSPNRPNENPHGPRHLGVPSGVSKMTSEPIVRSAQTMHLSCVRISKISKRTESSWHLSLVTKEYHWVRPKRF